MANGGWLMIGQGLKRSFEKILVAWELGITAKMILPAQNTAILSYFFCDATGHEWTSRLIHTQINLASFQVRQVFSANVHHKIPYPIFRFSSIPLSPKNIQLSFCKQYDLTATSTMNLPPMSPNSPVSYSSQCPSGGSSLKWKNKPKHKSILWDAMNLHEACKSPDFEAVMTAKHANSSSRSSSSSSYKKFLYWNQIAIMTDANEIPECDRVDLYWAPIVNTFTIGISSTRVPVAIQSIIELHL